MSEIDAVASTTPGPPDEGQTVRCAGCTEWITWSFDDPDRRAEHPYGLWADALGRDVCPSRPEDAEDFFHIPAAAGQHIQPVCCKVPDCDGSWHYEGTCVSILAEMTLSTGKLRAELVGPRHSQDPPHLAVFAFDIDRDAPSTRSSDPAELAETAARFRAFAAAIDYGRVRLAIHPHSYSGPVLTPAAPSTRPPTGARDTDGSTTTPR